MDRHSITCPFQKDLVCFEFVLLGCSFHIYGQKREHHNSFGFFIYFCGSIFYELSAVDVHSHARTHHILVS